MRKITKLSEPHELVQAKERHQKRHYNELDAEERQSIREHCLIEQKGLCAFCCAPMEETRGRNAHLQSQSRFPQYSLDWNNIVLSCDNRKHCDRFQDNKPLPITPLMNECETDFIFYTSGKVKGLTLEAEETIRNLGLDNPTLNAKRKKAIDDLFYIHRFDPIEDIHKWDADLFLEFINILSKEEGGHLAPYSPVLINVLQYHLGVKQA